MENIVIKTLVLGELATNCMLIIKQERKEMIIVDPADSAELISEAATRLDCRPAAIFLTHGHFDHTLAVEDLKDLYEIPVYAYAEEQDILSSSKLNLSAAWAAGYTTKADHLLKDRQTLEAAGMKFTVLYTPGHTKGSCCYYLPEAKALFSGDTLFAGSVGRMDFPTSSGVQMKNSLKKLLTEIPEDVLVYPGHGDTTTIGYEKRYNPFA